MRKKGIISIFIIILLFQLIHPIKINALTEKTEINSTPAQIKNYNTENNENSVNEATGIDVMTGIMLEPTVEFVTVIIDAVSGILNSFMMPEGSMKVMVKYDELPEELKVNTTTPEEGMTTITLTEEQMEDYKIFDALTELRYPKFSYSPEEIFAGKVDILNIDFISGKNSEGDLIQGGWADIRYVVSEWYKITRMVTIIGLLAVLIYTGIKIIISSNSKDKAKYKEMILNWFIAVILAFSMHYIMAFIINVIKELTSLLGGLTGQIQVICEGGESFKTNLIGFARFQMQQIKFSAKIGHLVIYVALIAYTFKFTFIYLKRVLKMALLTVISPIVALTYPIDKMGGKAQGFEMWLKEYIYNALLQLMHYILYYILVTTSLTLAAKNPIYGIVALMFISQAERLLKKIFGFDKAKAGTVVGLAGAYATGAITSRLTKIARDPLHPFAAGGKGKGKSGGSGGTRGQLGSGGNYSFNNDEVPNGTKDDINPYDFINSYIGSNLTQTQNQTQAQANLVNSAQPSSQTITGSASQASNPITSSTLAALGVDDFISRYRTYLSQYSNDELGGLTFDEGDPLGSIDRMIEALSKYQDNLNGTENTPNFTINLKDELLRLKESSIFANEFDFGGNLQYIDGDSRSTGDIVDEIIRLNALANDTSLPADQRIKYAKDAEKLLQLIKRRMIENQYMQRQGGVQALKPYIFNNMILNNIDGISQSISQYQMQLDNGVNIPARTLSLNDNLMELRNSLSSNPQYGESMGSLIDNVMNYNTLANNTSLNKNARRDYARRAQQGLEEVRRRMESTGQTINTGMEERPEQPANPIVSGYAGPRYNTEINQVSENRTENQERINRRAIRNMARRAATREEIRETRSSTGERIKSPMARGIIHVGKTLVKPIWDGEKENYNGRRLIRNIATGVAGVSLGIGAAAVQAGISITDGKYHPVEGIATIGAGVAGVSGLANRMSQRGGNIVRTYKEGANEGQTIEEYSEQWFNRDDIITSYNREYPGRGKEMRRRAVNNYVSRGITEFSEQKKAIKYAEVLRRERGMEVDEADRLAAATLRYKQALARSSNYYNILNNKEKRAEYIDTKVEIYTGLASIDSVRRLHEGFIQNVREFDEANR